MRRHCLFRVNPLQDSEPLPDSVHNFHLMPTYDSFRNFEQLITTGNLVAQELSTLDELSFTTTQKTSSTTYPYTEHLLQFESHRDQLPPLLAPALAIATPLVYKEWSKD